MISPGNPQSPKLGWTQEYRVATITIYNYQYGRLTNIDHVIIQPDPFIRHSATWYSHAFSETNAPYVRQQFEAITFLFSS